MDIAFVLNEKEDDGSETTLGVFDSPDIDEADICKYYGDGAEVIETLDIRDSGLEWQKKVSHSGGVSVLTLHYFVVGEI